MDIESAISRARELQPMLLARGSCAMPVPEGMLAVLASIPPAILGGPLSVLLKCLTACKVSAELNGVGIAAVPVCRIDPELPAGQTICLLDQESQLRALSSGDPENVFAEMARVVPERQRDAAFDFLRNHYSGPTPGAAVARLMTALAGSFGLIAIEGSVERVAGRTANFLPVAVQVLDPSEINDQEVVRRSYELAHRPAPVFWPRASVTILDARSRKFLDRHGLQPEDLFAGREELLERISPARPDALRRLEKLDETIQSRMSAFVEAMPPDEDLAELAGSARDRMLYQIRRLKERFAGSIHVRTEAGRRQLERACNALAPDGRPQEEVLATAYFLLRYSEAFTGLLYQRLDVSKPEHQLIPLD